jgi:hypothetical protein
LAILDKSIAGVLPFAVGVLFLVFSRMSDGGAKRPRLWRLVQAGIVAVAIVLPWHIYQYFVHYQWFLAEYLGVQLLAFGGKPPQTSQENQLVFYCTRLWLSDPVLTIVALLALPAWFRKRRDPLAILLLSWVVVFGGALMIFQYRSVQYMLPLIPALAIAAAAYCPFLDKRAALAGLCAIFVAKAMWADQLWGNSYARGSTLALADPLSSYCEQRRPNDLIVIESDDQFYSSVLPITHIRYGWSDPDDRYLFLEPHLRYLGILLQPAEFLGLAAKESIYRERLKQWGVASDKPIATAIAVHTPADFKPIVVARPGSDFLLPRYLIPPEALATHDVREAARDHVFLISKQPAAEPWEGPRWSCRM